MWEVLGNLGERWTSQAVKLSGLTATATHNADKHQELKHWVTPAPTTHSIWTVLKAGETIYQTGELVPKIIYM